MSSYYGHKTLHNYGIRPDTMSYGDAVSDPTREYWVIYCNNPAAKTCGRLKENKLGAIIKRSLQRPNTSLLSCPNCGSKDWLNVRKRFFKGKDMSQGVTEVELERR